MYLHQRAVCGSVYTPAEQDCCLTVKCNTANKLRHFLCFGLAGSPFPERSALLVNAANSCVNVKTSCGFSVLCPTNQSADCSIDFNPKCLCFKCSFNWACKSYAYTSLISQTTSSVLVWKVRFPATKEVKGQGWVSRSRTVQQGRGQSLSSYDQSDAFKPTLFSS